MLAKGGNYGHINRMKDRYFYPLVVAFLTAIIVYAMSFGRGEGTVSRNDIRLSGYTLAGEDLVLLTASPGTTFTLSSDRQTGARTAIAIAHATPEAAGASAGVFSVLGKNYEAEFAGRELEITIEARPAPDAPSAEFFAGYFSAGSGDSGWLRFPTSPEFKDYTFTFTPGAVVGDGNADYLGIWPDAKGEQNGIEVRRMTVMIKPSE